MRSVVAIYVENNFGVLTRVAGMFMRKGFNIDTLSVGETEDPRYSRITVTFDGDDYGRSFLLKQIGKLHEVKKVKLMKTDNNIEREHMLVKVRNTTESRAELKLAADLYHASIVDFNPDVICVEVSGEPSIMEAIMRSSVSPLAKECSYAMAKEPSLSGSSRLLLNQSMTGMKL